MKKIEINYTTNEQLWTLETVAEAHGYNKKNDCYWAQIFENAAGDQIITSRESTGSADPAADLSALLDENTTEAPAEAETTATTEQKQLAEIRRDMAGTLEALRTAEAREKAIRQDAAGMEACIKALRSENERLRALVARLQH